MEYSCRHVLAAMLFCYLCLCYMSRVDLNVTILAMVDETFASHESGVLQVTSFCGFTSGQKKLNSLPNMGRYEWNGSQQSLILGAFFWGYIFMQIPGGLLTLRYGPKRLGAVCIAGSALADLCVPILAQYGYWCLIVLRVIQGLFQGAVMPIVGCLLGRWVPLDQRSRYAAFVYAGTQFGAAVGQAVAGELSQTRAVWNPMTQAPNYVNHWPNVHHLFGTLGLLFSGWWYYLIFDWPDVHPRITQSEMDGLRRRYDPTVFGCSRSLERASSDTTKRADNSIRCTPHSKRCPPFLCDARVPWRPIFHSPPVWSVLMCHVAYNWCWYTLITCMPMYMGRVLGFDIASSGWLSSIPYVVQVLIAQVVARVSDLLIASRTASVTQVRRVNNLIALGGAGLGLVCVGLAGCRQAEAVMLLLLSVGVLGFASAGYQSNLVDLSPPLAANIVSITNTVATLPGIFGPLLVGHVTKYSSSVSQWMIVFSVSAVLAWFAAIFNLCFTSGLVQPWTPSRGETVAKV
ncbi:hypothetical protein P879_06112 [Paragonimus westermani]|uniref:Major facilitator superfamily (MFS) profile domain-containing protein n=1 Tax=Paragonimus westermani TaxID=34504 RepID=A0A8T0DL25_9TREM|nr:hypothetical protein P879_06112 [Paragonimus westermani]